MPQIARPTAPASRRPTVIRLLCGLAAAVGALALFVPGPVLPGTGGRNGGSGPLVFVAGPGEAEVSDSDVRDANTAPAVGSPGCASRACHGRSAPADPSARLGGMNEAGRWLRRDPHALAFSTLRLPRSERIARRLAAVTGGEYVPATDDVRCLACHAVPAARTGGGDGPVVAWTSGGGLGCAACHTGADAWVGPHVALGNLDEGDARRTAAKELGLPPLHDPSTAAATCAGCHLGAPPGGGLPARDVNHDLIGAGHPRLSFEFRSLFARLPRHWRDHAARPPADADPAAAWAVGQVEANRAWLSRLVYRARGAAGLNPAAPRVPWPEFAESACFDCHHELRADSWRGEVDRYAAGPHRPGVPHWGNPHAALLPTALAVLEADESLTSDAAAGVDSLTATMTGFAPDAAAASAGATDLLRVLAGLRPNPTDADALALRDRAAARRDDPAAWADAGFADYEQWLRLLETAAVIDADADFADEADHLRRAMLDALGEDDSPAARDEANLRGGEWAVPKAGVSQHPGFARSIRP